MNLKDLLIEYKEVKEKMESAVGLEWGILKDRKGELFELIKKTDK